MGLEIEREKNATKILLLLLLVVVSSSYCFHSWQQSSSLDALNDER